MLIIISHNGNAVNIDVKVQDLCNKKAISIANKNR